MEHNKSKNASAGIHGANAKTAPLHLTLPIDRMQARSLVAGQACLLSGTIYTARDAAHKRLFSLLKEGKPLPFPIENATIYYVGPSPAKPGAVIGSAGPTSAYRMDAFSPALIRAGETGMIGKGKRSAAVIDAMKTYGAVYFGAIGGCGALLAACVTKAEVIAYPDLGAEAVRRLSVRNLPVIVVIDAAGHNLYEEGPGAYLASVHA